MTQGPLYIATFDAIGDPLLVVDSTGTLLLANAAAMSWFDFDGARGLSQVRCRCVGYELDGATISGLIEAGDTVRGVPVHNARRETVAVVDVSPLRDRRGDAYLVHVRRIAAEDRAEFWRDDMISLVSHELRNPLSAMKYSVDLLLSQIPGQLTEGQKRFLGTSGRSIDRLTHLVDGFLDVSRIRSGAFEIERADIDVLQFLDRVVDSFRQVFNVQRLSLDCTSEADVHIACLDAAKLEQVVVNLLSNALKFTPAGGAIGVRARMAGVDVLSDDLRIMPWDAIGIPTVLQVDVTDNGIGMDAETLEGVFERFRGADVTDGAEDGKVRGVHLGLNISRKLIEAMGGWIEIDSQLGIGTTASVFLPADRRSLALVGRLHRLSGLIRRCSDERRVVAVYAVGKYNDENWNDIAESWNRTPVVNAGMQDPLEGTFYMWTMSGEMALVLALDGDAALGPDRLFDDRFVECDGDATLFPACAMGKAGMPVDAAAPAQLVSIAANRMLRAKDIMARATISAMDPSPACAMAEPGVER